MVIHEQVEHIQKKPKKKWESLKIKEQKILNMVQNELPMERTIKKLTKMPHYLKIGGLVEHLRE